MGRRCERKNAKKRKWAENRPKLDDLILQHCPKTVIIKLKAQPYYEKRLMSRVLKS